MSGSIGQLTAIPALPPTDLDGIERFYREHGFALVRDLYDDRLLAALDRECAAAQDQLARGTFPAADLVRHGTDVLDDPDAHVDGDGGVRRHLRGGWHGGERLDAGHGLDDFVKNAAR
jgi:hypothetical protein